MNFVTYQSVFRKTEYFVAELTIKDPAKIWQVMSEQERQKIIGENHSADLYEEGIYQFRITFNNSREVVKIERLLKLKSADPSQDYPNISFFQRISLDDNTSDAYDKPE